jgi:hypothetical protein
LSVHPLDVPSPPVVIGATGGSGTRVAARIVQRCGVYIGDNLNAAADALDIARYITRWGNRFLTDPDSPGLQEEMRADLAAVLEPHVARADGGAWGWKEPRSILLLPFLARVLPGLRFVHILRDGRDMAFSRNQNQPRRHGQAILGPGVQADSPQGSISLWREVNLRAARLGEEELGDRYLRVRYEDLCADPEPVIASLLSFLALEGDPAELAHEVRAPASIGRWRREDPAVVTELEQLAGPALARFGYAG